MEYQELIEKALNGRSVRRAAMMWDVPPPTMDRYARGERMPDVGTILKIIEDSGVSADEALKIIAAQEQLLKSGRPSRSRTAHQRIMRHILYLWRTASTTTRNQTVATPFSSKTVVR